MKSNFKLTDVRMLKINKKYVTDRSVIKDKMKSNEKLNTSLNSVATDRVRNPDQRGMWILPWSAYPHTLLAILLQAHTSGFQVTQLDRPEAYSLRVRLQKMQAGIREQADVPVDLLAAARSISWSLTPTGGDRYTLTGKPSLQHQLGRALPEAVVGEALLTKILNRATNLRRHK